MARTIDVSELIDREKLGRYQFLTFAFRTLFLFFDGIDGQMIGRRSRRNVACSGKSRDKVW